MSDADAEAVELAEHGDGESIELAWVAGQDVSAVPLHPGFAHTWPALRPWLTYRQHLVVDVANVMGARPDGWWRDRPGAATRLLSQLADLASGGLPVPETVPSPALGVVRVWPQVHAVLEGAGRGAAEPPGSSGVLEVVRAEGDGDDRVVAVVGALPLRASLAVVTADRELAGRVVAAHPNVQVLGPRRLLQAIQP